jgi:hypothetical protein
MVVMTNPINKLNSSSVNTEPKTEVKSEREITALARLISGKYREMVVEMHKTSKN